MGLLTDQLGHSLLRVSVITLLSGLLIRLLYALLSRTTLTKRFPDVYISRPLGSMYP